MTRPTDTALATRADVALDAVYQHRLLSTGQVHQLLTDRPSPRPTQRLLAELHRAGLVAWVAQRAIRPARVWFVTERGAEAVETIPGRAEPRRKLLTAEQARGLLQAHTLAVNEVGLAFVQAARERGDDCGPSAWQHEVAHPLGAARRQALIADAVLRYLHAEQPGRVTLQQRFVELDRATLPVEQLAAKLARYHQLHAYRPPRATTETWRQRYPRFPGLLVVFAGATPQRLRRRLHTANALWAADPRLADSPVRVAFCLLADLVAEGPFAAIFTTPDHDGPVDWLGRPVTA